MTSEARRRGARKHADRSWTCLCGRTVWGNGGKSSHKRACPVYLEAFPPPPPSDLELRRRAMAGDWPRDASDPWNLPDASCDHGEVDPRVCPRCQELAAARAGVADWLATGALEPSHKLLGIVIDGPDEIGLLARRRGEDS